MRGCMENMRRVSRTLKNYSADDFSIVPLIDGLPDVVAPPEQLEKDYSVR